MICIDNRPKRLQIDLEPKEYSGVIFCNLLSSGSRNSRKRVAARQHGVEIQLSRVFVTQADLFSGTLGTGSRAINRLAARRIYHAERVQSVPYLLRFVEVEAFRSRVMKDPASGDREHDANIEETNLLVRFGLSQTIASSSSHLGPSTYPFRNVRHIIT